jgi:putative transcriptional regulator
MKNKLKEFRKSNGFTLQRVAILAKTSKSYVWEIENEKSDPSLRIAYALSNAVGECVETVFPDPNDYNEHGDGFIKSVVRYGK